jgi:chromosome segregation ATPase
MEGEIKGLDSDIDDLMSEGDSLSKVVIPGEEIDNLQKSLNNAENEKDDIKARIVQSQKTLEGHLREKGEVISAVEEARPELENIRNDFTAFRDKIELYEKHPEEIERLKDRKPELEKQAQGYLKRAGTEQEELKHLNVAVDIINTELNTYKQAMQQISNLLNI